MRHFSLEQWADFARKIVNNETKAAMQAHLDSGCKQCTEAKSMWTCVFDLALREPSYEPPESAVRAAKGLLPIHGRSAKRPIVKLLFDSFQSPITAGVRSTATLPRQMLYGVGAYRIDVRMEPLLDSDNVSLTGQILSSAEPMKAVEKVQVGLLKGAKVLAESQTNSLGEFQLDCRLESRLQLRLTLGPGHEVKIPLLAPSEAAVKWLLKPIDSDGLRGKRRPRSKSTRKRV